MGGCIAFVRCKSNELDGLYIFSAGKDVLCVIRGNKNAPAPWMPGRRDSCRLDGSADGCEGWNGDNKRQYACDYPTNEPCDTFISFFHLITSWLVDTCVQLATPDVSLRGG
jgi:hypothetical protein